MYVCTVLRKNAHYIQTSKLKSTLISLDILVTNNKDKHSNNFSNNLNLLSRF